MFKMVNGVEVALTEEEILEAELREQDHVDRLAIEGEEAYKLHRETEYPSIKDLVVALIEKEEGRPEVLNALMLQRLQIKNKYPKP